MPDRLAARPAKWRDVDDIRHGKPASGLKDAKGLAEHLLLVRDEIDHAVRDHDVRSVVGDRQVFEFAKTEFDIPRADTGGVAARFFEHLVGHVDADNTTGL